MSKIASKIIALAATLALLVGFVFAGAYMQIVRAAVESADKTMSEVVKTNVTNRVKYGETFNVTQGSGTVTVKNPGGEYVTPDENGNVTANQVGIYEVTYSYSGTGDYGDYAGYTYNVEVYMDYEYKLVVEGNGAGIPTYWGTDSKPFTLPTATLYYLDEDTDTWFPDPDSADKVFVRVTQPDGTVSEYTKAQLEADAGQTVTTTAEGMYFFTYYANVGDGDNLYTQEYTTQVQNNFSDSAAPTLSISGVLASSSTNTEISLPTATVNDDYDGTRVNTTIRVTHTYAGTSEAIDVAQAVVDQQTGYVVTDADPSTEAAEKYYLAAEGSDREEYAYDEDGNFLYTADPAAAVKAKFDNDSFMSFYPTESGTYSVSYQAMDSTGRWEESTRNQTVAYSYPITVSDTTAPVYYDMDESLIPSTWGRQIVYKLDTSVSEDASDTTDLRDDDVDTAVQFPIPVIYDNAVAEENLSVSFTLTDPSSRTVLSFNNIYATTPSADNSYTLNGENYATGYQGRTYYFFRYWVSGNYTVDESTGRITGDGIGDNAYSLIYYNPEAGDGQTLSKGFFEFSMWVRSGYLGQYTATYRARDNSGNSASRTYNITLQQSFEDLALPTVDFDQPDYFIFRNYETEQTIDNVSATDSNDARLDVQYYVLFNQSGTFDSYIDDDGKQGDALTLDINEVADTDKVELSASGTTTLTLEKTSEGAFEIKVDDIHGDEQTRTLAGVTNNIYIVLKATDSAGNTAYRVRSVKVLDGTVTPDADDTYEPVFGATNSEVGQAGEEYNFGSFTINYGSYDERLYTGFELYVQRVQDADGVQVDESPLDNVSFEYYYDTRNADASGTNQIHVDNIRFTPSRAGTYMIVARGFHVSGASNVKMAFVQIDGSASNTNPSPTADISASMNYNVTYTLPTDYDVPAEWGDSGILRSISGGRCTVMGNEFTALQAVTYKFNDYVFEYDTAGNTSGNISNHLVKYAYTDGDSFAVSGKSLSSGIIASSQNSKHVGTQVSAVSDSETAVFRLLGVMPTYTPISTAEESVYVTLPNISASSVNGNATSLTVTITDQDGYEVAEVYDKDTPVSELPASLVSDNASTLVGNMFAFEATKDGTYTVTYNATLNNQTVSTSYTIRAGKVTSPGFTAEIGYINDTLYTSDQTVEASVGDNFDFADIVVTDTSSSGYTYQKTLVNPDGDTLATITVANRQNDGSSYEFTTSGSYRVTYTVTDDIGNTSYVTYTINVTTSSSSISSDAITTLAVVLIVVGVLLIAGVIVWFIRFRKRKG